MKLANRSNDVASPTRHPDENDWKAESDLRTLIDAEKIKKDKPRLKAALAKRDEQRTHLSSIRSPRN